MLSPANPEYGTEIDSSITPWFNREIFSTFLLTFRTYLITQVSPTQWWLLSPGPIPTSKKALFCYRNLRRFTRHQKNQINLNKRRNFFADQGRH